MTASSLTGRWIELGVTCDSETVEAVAALFADYGVNEGVLIDEPLTWGPDGEEVQIDRTRPVAVSTFLDREIAGEETIDEVREALSVVGGQQLAKTLFIRYLTVHKREDEDWADAWVASSSRTHVGRRVTVRAPWYDYQPAADEIVLTLDSGLAFGSGNHGSTRLAVVALEDELMPGVRVLDVGTGTGILAIAAARLGAGGIDAIDIDPVAVGIANVNAERNGVADIVRVARSNFGSEDSCQGEYDVVVANNVASLLMDLAPSLTRAVRGGGVLILSGIIDFKEAIVREAFEALGLRFVRRDELDGWVMLVLCKSEERPQSQPASIVEHHADAAPTEEARSSAIPTRYSRSASSRPDHMLHPQLPARGS
jgi:ribosomal protein L11 methyltransferase